MDDAIASCIRFIEENRGATRIIVEGTMVVGG
jgi:hypothetical protein